MNIQSRIEVLVMWKYPLTLKNKQNKKKITWGINITIHMQAVKTDKSGAVQSGSFSKPT